MELLAGPNHPDHLNTPRLVADAAGAAVWRWDEVEPFGVNAPDENPSSLGAFEFPLRFPGQYADKETGLHYNYFRDCDPAVGRYVESDPIGIAGGLNTYSYVNLDPLQLTDARGLLGSRGASPTFCGTGITKFITPESFGGANFGSACRSHDACWERCGADKLDCDERFYQDLLRACGVLRGDDLRKCRERALDYYTAVLYYGDSAYRSAQAAACKSCTPAK